MSYDEKTIISIYHAFEAWLVYIHANIVFTQEVKNNQCPLCLQELDCPKIISELSNVTTINHIQYLLATQFSLSKNFG